VIQPPAHSAGPRAKPPNLEPQRHQKPDDDSGGPEQAKTADLQLVQGMLTDLLCISGGPNALPCHVLKRPSGERVHEHARVDFMVPSFSQRRSPIVDGMPVRGQQPPRSIAALRLSTRPRTARSYLPLRRGIVHVPHRLLGRPIGGMDDSMVAVRETFEQTHLVEYRVWAGAEQFTSRIHCTRTLSTVHTGGAAPVLRGTCARWSRQSPRFGSGRAALPDQSLKSVASRPNAAAPPVAWHRAGLARDGAAGNRTSSCVCLALSWQSLHVATRVSPVAIRLPWVLVKYCAY
jgi:hypothetical protein